MQFFVQDKNFDVDYYDEESISPLHDLKLACNLGLDKLDKQFFELNSKKVIKIVKQEYVNKTIQANKVPTYQEFAHPYFTDYRKNYVERHDYNKDRLLILIKKLLQVPFEVGTTLMNFDYIDEQYDFIGGELSTEKLRWKKRTYTLKLRLYRFSLTSENEECGNTHDSFNESEDSSSSTSTSSSSGSEDMHIVEVSSSSEQTSSVTASGCGCCDECHYDCEGGCGCKECECGEVYEQILNGTFDEKYSEEKDVPKEKEEQLVEQTNENVDL